MDVRSLSLLIALTLLTPSVAAEPLCSIVVVDAETGWPVPLVELRTTHEVRFVSDNAGRIAFDLPELMGQPTWFFVEGHGYEVPADGFGYRGVRLTPVAGGKLTVKVKRTLPAKRLGRLTGSGLFSESQRLSLEQSWQDQGIFGCDSVLTAVHQGKMYWAWGDTTLARYPLGLFHTIGATTDLQPLKSFKPPVRLRYNYFFEPSGKPQSIAQMPGSGPTWLSGLVSLPDRQGRQRLVATYVKIKPPLTVYETGLCVWEEKQEQFQRHQVLWTRTEQDRKPPLTPVGHPVFWTDESGHKWVLFGDPFPRMKCAATFEAWSDPAAWQKLVPQSTVPTLAGKEKIKPHRGSIAWNGYRKKWVTVFTQLYGKPSALGELWYAEADSPTGPWGSAVKVVTHKNYTFYNPRLHPEFTPAGSPILLFEGTYTQQFANKPHPTPLYDYNQILYRLDLDDPALVPVSSSE